MERINVNCDCMIYSDEEKKSALECLENSDSSIFVGNTVSKFEQKLSKYLNVSYAIALPNCTLSIYTALQVLGIKYGDEVIVPNLTHASSIYPILMSGGKIKVFDFEPNSYYYDLENIKKLITPNTKFFLACYLYGMPLNIEEVKKICDENNIILIEDVAQAFGTKVNGKYAGTFGEIGCYSFNDTKMLRIGEGGAIVTSDKDIYEKVENFRHVGEVFNSTKQSSVSSNTTYRDLLFNGLSNMGKGLNLRPSPITFSTGLKRIDHIDEHISERRKKLKIYFECLSELKGLSFIKNFDINKIEEYGPIASWILLDNKYYDRNRIILGAMNMGIPVGSFNYNTISKNDYFRNFIINKGDDLINSQYVRDNSIFLPLYETLSLDDVNKISNAFAYVINNYDKNLEIFDERGYDEEINYFDGFYLMRKK
ncbi:MAG: aminotransferase class I/II-fold pyridoxal phosphate-dependent enzyme [bacterium]|nr:aminotransferase class I/II-fold pyridoxal phosphate-dependent enzyme [bacterium]